VISSHGAALAASGSPKEESVVDDREKEEVGKVTGSVAGALGGARLAAAILPVPLVGPFAGAVVGGVVGSEVGRRLSKAVINGAAAFVDTMREASPATADRGEPTPTTGQTSDETTGTNPTPVRAASAGTDGGISVDPA
jgi:phage tail tape-measure protein